MSIHKRKELLANIPKGWSLISLSDIAWYQEGPGIRKWQFRDQGVKVVNIRNMTNGVLDLTNTSRHISEDEANGKYNHFLCEEGDILVASSGSYGKHAIVRQIDLPLVMNTSVIRFKPLEGTNYEFLNQYLKSEIFFNEIEFMVTGGAQKNFGPSHLDKIKLKLPPIEEQIKIGNNLHLLDTKIDGLDKQVLEYKLLKKGLMQSFFSKGTNGIGTRDTKYGAIPNNWKIVRLGDIAEVIDPQPDHRTPAEVTNGVPYIGIGDIKEGEIDFENARKVSKAALDKQIKGFEIYEGAFIFGKIGTIGQPTIIPTERIYAYSANIILITSIDRSIADFLFYALQSDYINKQIRLMTNTTSQPALGIKKLREFKIPLSSELERIKITKALKLVDDKIECLITKKKLYSELRRGVMKQLLNGEIRVKTVQTT